MDLNAAVRDEAEALAAALRAGRIPRARRPLVRAALAAAFAACEAGRADADLLRRLDAQLHPLVPRIPAAPRLRPVGLRGALDPVLLARLEALGGLGDRIVARVDRFLAVTGIEGVGTVLRAPKTGDPAPVDMDLTAG